MNKRILSILLCAALVLCLPLPAAADTAQVRISTPGQFMDFAENCRLDTYSQGLTVILEQDIDLTGWDFQGVPIFSGVFEGNNHTISGLNLLSDGSAQGLFRYLTADAVVQNLGVRGQVCPGGSRSQVGAIAGVNAGLIQQCSFIGSVSGKEQVGGIAGLTTVTGSIYLCSVSGDVHGDHFVGGITGENQGVLRSCTNKATVNTTPQQNDVSLSDITMDTLTNTESAGTVTDVGGIAGISSGVIRSCGNHGDVGYRQMGYNIGGIAGTQSGYITDCENRGNVQGRKEVGGIAGQMEPSSLIEFSQDTFQILEGQLGTMSALVHKASGNATANAGQISSQLSKLQRQAETLRDALDMLTPEPGEIPDLNKLQAAQSTLASTLRSMGKTMGRIGTATQSTLTGLTRDLEDISHQITAMGDTVRGASDTLGGVITDISDQDTPDLLTGKVSQCKNLGSVLADLNVGGIAGAMAMENDLDIAEDWEQLGEDSLNFQSQVRAVILDCENRGTVTGQKQNAGGITGWQSLGLVKNCGNYAEVSGRDYVGGITGLGTGYIRQTYAKCTLTGATCVGGIVGSGTIVTGSLSQVTLVGGREKLGAIAGIAQQSDEEAPIRDNYYLSQDPDPGAIDGISYAGAAQPLALAEFLALENLPESFQTVTVRFQFPDGSTQQIRLTPGDSLSPGQIPTLPQKAGVSGSWEGLETLDLSHILFDMTFRAVYSDYATVIQSPQTRENGRPLLLLEGSFPQEAQVSLTESPDGPEVQEKETLLEAWNLTASHSGTAARLLLPEEIPESGVTLLLRDGDGAWYQPEFHRDGSYLVFRPDPADTGVALVQTAPGIPLSYILAGSAAAVLLAVATFLWIRAHRRRKKQTAETLSS